MQSVRRLPIENLLSDSAQARDLGKLLRGGGVAAVPTESAYGLATDPRSDLGVERIRALKGRSADKPLLVLCADREQLASLGLAAPDELLARFGALWPAALTVVFALAEPIAASLGGATLAVRIPAEPRLRTLLKQTGPVTGTSLNRSGAAPCTDPDEAERLFSSELDVLVDGGATRGGAPSTLVDATVDPPRLLRAGAFAWPPTRNARDEP